MKNGASIKHMNFLRAFIDDCRYYDRALREVHAIVSAVDLRGKTVLDVGTGIGRLALPLARFAKGIVAIDRDKRFMPYWNNHHRRNVRFLCTSLEAFSRRAKASAFDVALLAWPTMDSRIFSHIKKVMGQKSVLIFITCDPYSDYETIVDQLQVGNRRAFERDIRNKERFLRAIPRRFHVLKRKSIATRYVFPNKSVALRVIIQSLALWFGIALDASGKKRLQRLIERHRRGRKVVFGERIFFFALGTKEKVSHETH